MTSLILGVFLIFGLSIIVFLVAWGLSCKMGEDSEKGSPFECGFDPKGGARAPFSLRFFLLAVIFLVFDVEISIILPIPLAIISGSMEGVIICGRLFVVILLLGLFHEWKEGSLDWS